MKVLVTGGAGFIGHHLVRALAARGDEVRVIDDLSSGSSARLDGLDGDVTVVRGSILDRPALDEATADVEVILHQAAIASVARSVLDPVETNEVNVRGTIEVMLAANKHGVRRVVFASSSAVYGIPDSLPCRESMRTDTRSPYGASKAAGEQYLHSLGELHGVETVALRYFNVFGAGQEPESEYAAVVPRFITAVLDGRPPRIFGTGDISRDFIHVDDVVQANLLASAPASPTRLTCNVAAGTAYSLLDLLAAVATATGLPADPEFGPARPGDIKTSLADIAVATETLGFRVTVPFQEGIERTVAAFRTGRPQERAR